MMVIWEQCVGCSGHSVEHMQHVTCCKHAELTNIDRLYRFFLTSFRARFTRAVAELQFLGFIKTSKKKTDHVTRLTWGSS
jgi:hypothetical protein